MDPAESLVKEGEIVVADEPVIGEPRKVLSLDGVKSLQELQREYVFYTPGVIFSQLPIDGDPFYLEGVQGFSFQCEKPLFEGLEIGLDATWNHVLFAVHHENWGPVSRQAVSTTFFDQAHKILARIRPHELQVIDPLFAGGDPENPGSPYFMTITAFGLDTNRGKVYLAPPAPTEQGDLLLSGSALPRLRIDPDSYPDTVEMAEKMFESFAEAAQPQEPAA